MSLTNNCPLCGIEWNSTFGHSCQPTKTPLSLDEFDAVTADGFRMKISLIDKPIFDAHEWTTLAGRTEHRYAVRRKKENGQKILVRFHRLILNAPLGSVVDHINGDTLDNRRANLRICTHSKNMMNKGSILKQSALPKNIAHHKSKFKVQFKSEGKSLLSKLFDTLSEAVIFRDEWMRANNWLSDEHSKDKAVIDGLRDTVAERERVRDLALKLKSETHEALVKQFAENETLKSEIEKLRPVIQELREANANCISINLHESRIHYAEAEIQALKAEIERLKNPKLKIGQYEICEFHNGNYWIEHESGEAMETAKDKLEACITQFYADNF